MKRFLFRLMSGAVVLSLIAGCTKAGKDDSLNEVLEKGTFVVGLDATFAPLGFLNDENEIVGFDIDIAREVCERLGVELVLQPIDWDAKMFELESKTIDAIWNGFTITPSRQEQVQFSLPYLNNRQIILTDDTSIDSVSDLAGKKVGVQLQSSGQTALEANAVYANIQEEVKFDTYTLALADLEVGRVDAIVIDETMGRYINSKLTTPFLVVEEDLGDEEYGIGFRKNDTKLVERINVLLQEMKSDGTSATISDFWFGEDLFLTGID